MVVPLLMKPAFVIVGRELAFTVSIVRPRVRMLTFTPESP